VKKACTIFIGMRQTTRFYWTGEA